MKITKSNLVGIVSLASLVLGSTSAFAAPVGTAKTKGEITFTERTGGGDGNVLLPSQPPVIVTPVDPSPSTPAGPLMITDAPKFDFGTVEISGKDELYSAKTSAYFKVVDGVTTSDKIYSAPIVQIEDVRKDTATQTWALAVSATPFKTVSDAELTGAEIRVQNKGIVFNNSVASPGDKNPVGISTTTSGYTIGSSPKVVMSSAAGKGNGKSSLVLDSGFKNDGTKADGSAYTETDKIDDVQLFVPITANKVKDTVYTSTITWSLYNTPEAIGTTPAA